MGEKVKIVSVGALCGEEKENEVSFIKKGSEKTHAYSCP